MVSKSEYSSSDAIELVIFDLDGVLVDSEILSADLLIKMAAEIGVDIDLIYVRRNFIGKNFQTVMTHLSDNFDVSLSSHFEREYLDRLAVSFEEKLHATEGIRDVLQSLNTASCIATSSPLERATNSLRICQLSDFFADKIFNSAMVKRPKPAPDLFEFACHNMGFLPHQCLVVEDSVAGLKAGLAADMRVCRYIGASHLKGRERVNVAPDGVERTFDNWQDFTSIYPTLFV